MNSFMGFLLLCVVAAVYASHGEEHVDYFAPAHYNFDYAVKDPHTGDNKHQWEKRHGDHVEGEYTLHEADGTIRVVHYVADPHKGFNAEVKRIGHAQHPQHYKTYDEGHHY
ncbi:adult-specific cuticular protein ACP-20-like [Chrysoperla carnea]|uniref:adult-specific cuticular protein ACP-20-like n=1 Tax=Chrysoperla carnea TaxID=189513 RepID=UPI001D092CF9|nr:adult-specific cuticular protein ACP-20-like [Chrysoperla carnea]